MTRKSRPKKSLVEAAPTPLFAPRQEHDPLRAGDIVMLPDGAVAAIERIVGTDAYVVEWTKRLGRGPWIFPLSELAPVS